MSVLDVRHNMMKTFAGSLLPSLVAVPVGYVLGLIIMFLILVNEVPTYGSRAIIEIPGDAYEVFKETKMNGLLSPEVQQEARSSLTRSIAEIRKPSLSVNAVQHNGTSFIVLAVESVDPVFSAEYANAWALAAIEHLTAEEEPEYGIHQRAMPAASPMSPRKTRSVFRAGALGAIAGLGVAFLLAAAITLRKQKRGEPSAVGYR